MSSPQIDPNIMFAQSLNAMNSYFRNKPLSETLGIAMLFTWWFSGMIEDPYLFIISMIIVLILFINGFVESINQKISITGYVGGSFRRMITGLWAQGMYLGGSTPGPETLKVSGLTVNITLISGIVVSFYAIFWFSSKFIDRIDLDDDSLLEPNTILLVARGLFRGLILAGLFYSVFTKEVISGNYEMLLLASYIIEPIAAYYQATYEDTIDPMRINLGLGKIPISELRSVMLTNALVLILSIWFKGIQGDNWGMLRTLYILIAIVVFVWSMYTIKEYNKDPLARSILASMLRSTGKTLDNMDISEKMGFVIPDDFNIQNKINNINILKDSIIIPLGEEKGRIRTIIVGRAEYMMKSKEELLSKLVDGVSTTFLNKKDLDRLTKQINPQLLSELNLDDLQLPSLDQIQKTLNLLAFSLGGWLTNLKNELSRVDLSNYGVSEIDGVTNVRLPAISVYESDDITKVDVMGIQVVETLEYTNVRVGSWISVLEVPKFTLVDLAGFITVLEVQGVGTAVNIMGFKISDGIDASMLDAFKDAISTQLQQYDKIIDNDVGRILLEKDAQVLMSVNWEGEFKPLLQGSKDAVGDHPALIAGSDTRMIAGGEGKSLINPGFSELTGITGTKKKKKETKNKTLELNVGENILEIGSGGNKNTSIAFREISDEIDEALNRAEVINPEFIDAEYEISEVSAAKLECVACGNKQSEGQYCLSCGTAFNKNNDEH